MEHAEQFDFDSTGVFQKRSRDVQFTPFKPAASPPGLQRHKSKLTGEIMLIQKLRDVLRAMFIGSLLLALPHNMFAQNQSQSVGKTAAKKSKASAASCDGALDIVPVKSMTFTRKRRPSKPEARTEQPNPTDAKDAKPEKR